MKANSLPDLEVVCTKCLGKRIVENSQYNIVEDCDVCRGSGFTPTLFGARVLALVRHNVSAELRVASES